MWIERGNSSLDSRFKADSSRELLVKLYEEDTDNSDDHVLDYIGEFTGRKLTSFKFDEFYDKGKIDSTGDQTAELYIMANMTQGWSDEVTKFSNIFFNYRIGMK